MKSFIVLSALLAVLPLSEAAHVSGASEPVPITSFDWSEGFEQRLTDLETTWINLKQMSDRVTRDWSPDARQQLEVSRREIDRKFDDLRQDIYVRLYDENQNWSQVMSDIERKMYDTDKDINAYEQRLRQGHQTPSPKQ